jgi:hypothetical protein
MRAALSAVVLTLCLLAAVAASGQDIAGSYNVLLKGNNYSFDANSPVQAIGGLTTMKISQKGTELFIEISPCGEMPALQLRGQAGGDCFVAVGCNTEPGMAWGRLHLDKGAITGSLVYPWEKDGGDKPKPDDGGKPPPKILLGVAEFGFLALRETPGGASPFKSEDVDKPKPPPNLEGVGPSMDLTGRYGADVVGSLYNAATGQVKNLKGVVSFTLAQKGEAVALSVPGVKGTIRELELPCQAGGNLIMGLRWDPKTPFTSVLFYGLIVPAMKGISGVLVGPAVWDDTDIVHQPAGPLNYLLDDRFGAVKYGAGGDDGTRPPPPPPPHVEFGG